jgi:predicted RNA-binding Zn ribbon-like protein
MRSFKPPAKFIADSKALDFLNSGSDELDWMDSGEKLLAWLDLAGLVPRAMLQKLERDHDRKALDRVAFRVRKLRAWLGDIVERHHGKSLTGADVSAFHPLNRILMQDVRYPQIVSAERRHASAPVLESMRHWGTPNVLLWTIAETVARLICEENFAQIRRCEGCSLVFVDRTRQQARKWCSMSTCGNRAKQAAHRHRHRSPRG